jgi:hypothetical protein
MKKEFFVFTLIFSYLLVFAEESEERNVHIVPILNYEFVSEEHQKYHLPGGGLILLKGDQSPSWEEKPDSIMIGALYKSTIINEILPDYPHLFHSIELIGELRKSHHFIQALISSYSDKPLYGGMHTAYSQIGYGYQILRKENIRLTLGAALGLSDFGFDLPNGGTWPLLPSPILEFCIYSKFMNVEFSWPELKVNIGPESRIRLTNTVRLDIWKFHDVHDMLFDSVLWYRFFDKDFAYGDFAGIGVGIKNGGLDFTLCEKWKYYDTHYYSVFGILDASLLKISGGYIFYSREFYEADNSKPAGRGWFISAQVLWQF